VVDDGANPAQQMLLCCVRLGHGRPLRRPGELVDEFVDAGGREGGGGCPAEELLPCQRHRYEGRIRTSPRISRSRFAITCGYENGGATCSLTVYSEWL